MQQFGVSVQQASSDLDRYIELAPDDTVYDNGALHAIGLGVLRGYRRAFGLTDDRLMNFLLSWILDIRGSRECETSVDEDLDWHSEVTLDVGRHLALFDTQAKVIPLDYGRGGRAKVKLRRSLMRYALRWHGLDTDPAALRPQDQQIVLLNRDQISQTAQGFMQ